MNGKMGQTNLERRWQQGKKKKTVGKRETRGTKTLKDNDTVCFEVLFCCTHHGTCLPHKISSNRTAPVGLHPVAGEADAKAAISALHNMLKENGRGRDGWDRTMDCSRVDVTVMAEEGM